MINDHISLVFFDYCCDPEIFSINANILNKLYLNGANQELQDEITEKLQKAKMVLVKNDNTITIM